MRTKGGTLPPFAFIVPTNALHRATSATRKAAANLLNLYGVVLAQTAEGDREKMNPELPMLH